MRLSEKTLELNICAQVARLVAPGQNLLWFGLTQRQEARAGFDACTKFGGRLLIFQFKASNRVLRSKDRLFLAPHDQMMNLRARANGKRRSVFYAFPLAGTTHDLHKNPDLLSQTWLLDVSRLPLSIQRPEKSPGVPRKNQCHNVYVRPGIVSIHSDPLDIQCNSLESLVQSGFEDSDGIGNIPDGHSDDLRDFLSDFSVGARGLVVWTT